LTDDQIKELHTAIHYVCSTSIEVLADSDKFPEHWLFKHRWSKGKKNKTSTLPNGEKISFLTVGGRTSAVVPSVQKKTGPVAGDVKDEEASSDEREVKRKRTAPKKDEPSTKKPSSKRQRKQTVKTEDEQTVKAEDEGEAENSGRRRSTRLRK
jgi:formamidopyrimidine-DNA glycosylase